MREQSVVESEDEWRRQINKQLEMMYKEYKITSVKRIPTFKIIGHIVRMETNRIAKNSPEQSYRQEEMV